MVYLVQILVTVIIVVLLLNVDEDRAVRLFLLLKDLIFGVGAVHLILAPLPILPGRLHRGVMVQFFTERKVDGLKHTGRFDSFHNVPS